MCSALRTHFAVFRSSMCYLHRDHLGSPELITDSSGNAVFRPSFAAYGERRDGSDWDGAISSANLDTLAGITRRGFTGHEHLDSVGLIHMNGRVFEPVAGRFLSVDPYIDGWASSQGPNGFAYVHNNPLSLIDPSGFLTAPKFSDIERRCDANCFSVGQKFPFLDLFREPDWTDRWRTIPNPFVQVQPQQSQPRSPHAEREWDGASNVGSLILFGADNGSQDAQRCVPPLMDRSAEDPYDPWDKRGHLYVVVTLVGINMSNEEVEEFFVTWRSGLNPMPGAAADTKDDVPTLLTKLPLQTDRNWAYMKTDWEKRYWENLTLPSHIFHRGKVTNAVVTRGPLTFAVTIGKGVGRFPGLNMIVGYIFFEFSQLEAISRYYSNGRAGGRIGKSGSCNFE